MARNIVVERIKGTGAEEQRVEVVERKGLGHPDYMADSIAEAFSRGLSRYYVDNFGKILHHNVDKLEIIGGKAAPEFGGGEIIIPVSILFSGRATDAVGDRKVPVREIATSAADEWLKKNIRYFGREGIRYLFETKSGAPSLQSLYERYGIFSNDTSFGAGYAPLTTTESLVLGMERMMNAREFKEKFPFSGEDVKVLAVRNRKKLEVTVADAFIGRFVPSIDDYFDLKAKLLEEIESWAEQRVPPEYSLRISLNNLDSRKQGKDGCYLTVTGTSAEHGDDGSVGRGNRVNGLITPNRTMSFEAVAGKNPVSHIGKLYNILAERIAFQVYEAARIHNTVKIVGRIGERIDQPQVAVVSTSDSITPGIRREIRAIVDGQLSDIEKVTMDLLEGKAKIC